MWQISALRGKVSLTATHAGAQQNAIHAMATARHPAYASALGLPSVRREILCRRPVTARVHDDIGDFSLLVHRAPETLRLAADPHQHLAGMPAAQRARTPPPEPLRANTNIER